MATPEGLKPTAPIGESHCRWIWKTETKTGVRRDSLRLIQSSIVSMFQFLSVAFANRRMAPQKSSVSKKKFSATTSLGAASSIGR